MTFVQIIKLLWILSSTLTEEILVQWSLISHQTVIFHLSDSFDTYCRLSLQDHSQPCKAKWFIFLFGEMSVSPWDVLVLVNGTIILSGTIDHLELTIPDPVLPFSLQDVFSCPSRMSGWHQQVLVTTEETLIFPREGLIKPFSLYSRDQSIEHHLFGQSPGHLRGTLDIPCQVLLTAHH